MVCDDDIAREDRIRVLSNELRFCGQDLPKPAAHKVCDLITAEVYARSPEQVAQMERELGLA